MKSIYDIPFEDLRVSVGRSNLPYFEDQVVVLRRTNGGSFQTARGFLLHVSNRGTASYTTTNLKGTRHTPQSFRVDPVRYTTFEDPALQEQALDHALALWGYDLGRDGAKILFALDKIVPIVEVLRELRSSPDSLSAESILKELLPKGYSRL